MTGTSSDGSSARGSWGGGLGRTRRSPASVLRRWRSGGIPRAFRPDLAMVAANASEEVDGFGARPVAGSSRPPMDLVALQAPVHDGDLHARVEMNAGEVWCLRMRGSQGSGPRRCSDVVGGHVVSQHVQSAIIA